MLIQTSNGTNVTVDWKCDYVHGRNDICVHFVAFSLPLRGQNQK